MGRRLTVYVEVDGAWYGPNDKVPADAAKQIGDHAWEDYDDESESTLGSGQEQILPPPMSGKGSGTDEWAKYASDLGVDVPDDAKRDDIVTAVREAGHPVETPGD